MNHLMLGLLVLLRLTHTPAPYPASYPFMGIWVVADKDARVEITRQGEIYTGRYVAFTDPAAARKKGDVSGGVLLKNMKNNGDELTGKVVDPETKKEYNATLTAQDVTHIILKVKVMGVTAHTETWTRVVASTATVPTPGGGSTVPTTKSALPTAAPAAAAPAPTRQTKPAVPAKRQPTATTRP